MSKQVAESHSRSCPLCGSARTRTILAESDWSIRACGHCTNAWTVPSPGQVEYSTADFHASAANSDDSDQAPLKTADDLPEEWKAGIYRQVQLIGRHVRTGARILEIGCGDGILLAELSREGYDVQGIEPSTTGSARARRRGLSVTTGYFPHVECDGHYDVVILSHVLEHLSDPLAILEAISRIAPHGYLLLVQTHYKGLLPRWYKGNWYAWVQREHFWHFTPKGLAMIARRLGFVPVDNEYSSLVHGPRQMARVASAISTLYPPILDQFHCLLKAGNTSGTH